MRRIARSLRCVGLLMLSLASSPAGADDPGVFRVIKMTPSGDESEGTAFLFDKDSKLVLTAGHSAYDAGARSLGDIIYLERPFSPQELSLVSSEQTSEKFTAKVIAWGATNYTGANSQRSSDLAEVVGWRQTIENSPQTSDWAILQITGDLVHLKSLMEFPGDLDVTPLSLGGTGTRACSLQADPANSDLIRADAALSRAIIGSDFFFRFSEYSPGGVSGSPIYLSRLPLNECGYPPYTSIGIAIHKTTSGTHGSIVLPIETIGKQAALMDNSSTLSSTLSRRLKLGLNQFRSEQSELSAQDFRAARQFVESLNFIEQLRLVDYLCEDTSVYMIELAIQLLKVRNVNEPVEALVRCAPASVAAFIDDLRTQEIHGLPQERMTSVRLFAEHVLETSLELKNGPIHELDRISGTESFFLNEGWRIIRASTSDSECLGNLASCTPSDLDQLLIETSQTIRKLYQAQDSDE